MSIVQCFTTIKLSQATHSIFQVFWRLTVGFVGKQTQNETYYLGKISSHSIRAFIQVWQFAPVGLGEAHKRVILKHQDT